MITLLRDIILMTIAVVLAIVAAFGIASDRSEVPSSLPPPLIETEERTETEAERKADAEEVIILEEKEVEIIVNEDTLLPPVETNEEDPFRGVREAFEQLAREQHIPAPPSPQEIPLFSPPVGSEVNEVVRSTLVNVVCSTKGGGPYNSISASGVVIDPRGVILTNAHVAQYFLLKNYPVPGFTDCFIRAGSPARNAYTAELLFLPPSWIAKNAEKIDDALPTGNGEHDYAFLLITGTLTGGSTEAPALPHLPIRIHSPELGDRVLVAGYPAGFLGGLTIQQNLFAASAHATVRELFTYGTQQVDLFSIGGTIVAQQGSSGGAVSDGDGNLVGLIVTSSQAEETSARDLRAITTEYIIRDFSQESGVWIEDFFRRNMTIESQKFNTGIAPALSSALISVFEN